MALRRGTPLVDKLPELYLYKDDGCEFSPSCLNCSFPRCKYDDPGWIQRERRKKRDRAVMEARQRDGLTVLQLARRFRVSERTIFRILSSNGAGHALHPRSTIVEHNPEENTRARREHRTSP